MLKRAFLVLGFSLLAIVTPNPITPRGDVELDDPKYGIKGEKIHTTWHAFDNRDGGASCHPSDGDVAGQYDKYRGWDPLKQPLVAWGKPGRGRDGWREGKGRATFCYHQVTIVGSASSVPNAVIVDTKDEGGLDISDWLWNKSMGTLTHEGSASIHFSDDYSCPVTDFCERETLPGWLQSQNDSAACKCAVEGFFPPMAGPVPIDGSGGASSGVANPSDNGAVAVNNGTGATNSQSLLNVAGQPCPWNTDGGYCDCSPPENFNVQTNSCPTCIWDDCCKTGQKPQESGGTCARGGSTSSGSMASPMSDGSQQTTNGQQNIANGEQTTNGDSGALYKLENGIYVDTTDTSLPLHNFNDKPCPWNANAGYCDCKFFEDSSNSCKTCIWDKCCMYQVQRDSSGTCQTPQSQRFRRWAVVGLAEVLS